MSDNPFVVSDSAVEIKIANEVMFPREPSDLRSHTTYGGLGQ